ncbi:MAG TPA: FGGY-family carbohydrate kinase, partial [Planctomycetaceae bacterium]|nr:FGGY-family carbohydrate kinase [Planctomycetaceae bacterium]
QAMQQDLAAQPQGGSSALTVLQVDGGATANSWLMQFQADLLGLPVRRPVVQETTALGAAYLAGLAVGVWQNQDELRKHWALDREFRPEIAAESRASLYAGWRRAVERSRGWAVEG